MATKDDRTKTIPPGRNPAAAAQVDASGDASAASPAEEFELDPEDALVEAIDKQRGRLMQAESLLDCALVVMDKSEGTIRGPYYPGVIEAARDMVKESVNELDSMNIRPLIKRIQDEAKASVDYSLPEEKKGPFGNEVREPRIAYLYSAA